MKNLIFLFTALALLGISACEEVIDLDLKTAQSKVVIEAALSDQNETQVVRISETVAFTETGEFKPLSGAQVVLTTPSGFKVSFNETNPGIYRSSSFRGIPGNTYRLDVTVNGQIYSATSTMPRPVKLESLTFKELTFFGETNNYPVITYTDPGSLTNQYRYIVRVQNKVEADQVTEDRFNDGNLIEDVIFTDLDEVEAGEVIEVELQGIDRNVFKYFFAIAQIGGEGGPPVAPANPESNFSNGALGVFNAHTSSKISVVRK